PMPIYEYQCTSCHHHFDLMQKASDKPVTQCPNCGEDTVVKLISAAGFQLKGTGWYATDFKNKDSVATKAAESSDDKTSDSAKTTEQSTKEPVTAQATTEPKKSTQGDTQ